MFEFVSRAVDSLLGVERIGGSRVYFEAGHGYCAHHSGIRINGKWIEGYMTGNVPTLAEYKKEIFAKLGLNCSG